MSGVKVLVWSVAPKLKESLQRKLSAASPRLAETVEWCTGSPDAFNPADLASATVVVADPPLFAPYVDDAASMQWLQSTFAGVDNMFVETTRRDYLLTRSSGMDGATCSARPACCAV